MCKTILTLFLAAVLLITAQACAAPVPATPDPRTINTAIAETFAAALTQTAQPGIPITGPETPTPTATRAASPTPFPTFTPVSTIPQISVSVPTNCRVGPGTAYDRVGALLVGEVAEVVGRAADRDYWIIRNPDRAGGVCWLWGEHATLTGVTGALPVFTPPPLPTPSLTPTPSITPTATVGFTAAYRGLESCTATGWWVDIELANNGGIPIQSMALTLKDTTNDATLSLYSDDFTNRNGCDETDTRADLFPGTTLLVSTPAFNYDPTGHELRAIITLCSSAGQSGRCVTQAINFTP